MEEKWSRRMLIELSVHGAFQNQPILELSRYISENRDGLSQQIHENSVLDWLSIHLSCMYHAHSYSLNE